MSVRPRRVLVPQPAVVIDPDAGVAEIPPGYVRHTAGKKSTGHTMGDVLGGFKRQPSGLYEVYALDTDGLFYRYPAHLNWAKAQALFNSSPTEEPETEPEPKFKKRRR